MRCMISQKILDFNPRSPHGERRRTLPLFLGGSIFQSTLPARGATAFHISRMVERSAFQSTLPARGATINLRNSPISRRFQSTLPARGATKSAHIRRVPEQNFNPRSPHGERPSAVHHGNNRRGFQSTLPARGATHTAGSFPEIMVISIHAPRTGSDGIGSSR